MYKRSHLFALSVIFVLLACSDLACERQNQQASPANDKPLVVCTTTMISDLARNICGGRFEVVGIMRPGEDPHIYTPRPTDALLIRKAKLLLRNGLHLEGTLAKIIDNNLAPGAVQVAVAEDPRIKPLESEQYKGAPDPHCWFNIAYFRVYAEKCSSAMSQVDPAGKEIYEKAENSYRQQLEELEKYTREQLATIPKQRRVLITSHDAFQYFGRAYDVEVHALIGISTEQEPKPQDVENLVKLIGERQIKSVFIETSVSGRLNNLVRKVSSKAAVEVGGTLYSDSLAEPDSPCGTYIGMLHYNVDTIVKALR
jgi:ABC-type Zn uptake system ZnuABC Zn-binding protein ZnuA